MADENQNDITALTVQLLSAFVSKNTVSSEGLAELIKTTRAALTNEVVALVEPAAPEYVPAVSVRKSLSSPDHILSLIDGKPYKTLKRHLATHGLTDKDYRARYNLPASYPMVAPSYSEARRAVAEKLGLGKKPVSGKAEKPAVSAAAVAPLPKAEPKAASKKAPAKKLAAKSAAATPAKVTTPTAVTAVEPKKVVAKAALAPKSDRKKLSIAGPKGEKPTSAPVKAEQAKPADAPKGDPKGNAAPKAKAAAPKAKAAAKPKSLKVALKAAGDHLSANTDAPAAKN